MDSSRKLWVDEITDVLRELGGKGSLLDIRKKVKERGIIPYKESSIPRTLERYCSDCERFCGKKDSFYIVERNGRTKIWGLRGYYKDGIPNNSDGSDNEDIPTNSLSKNKIEPSPLVPFQSDSEDSFKHIPEEKTEYSEQKFKKRMGQSDFRKKVLNAYGSKCCITNETCLEVLQAAHIQAYVNEESNHIQNGICFRMDIHKLFDEGLIVINDQFRIVVSHILQESSYKQFDGREISLPLEPNAFPSLHAIRKHRERSIQKGYF